jgi:hypothetical protein
MNRVLAVAGLAATCFVFGTGTARATERYLHVRVDGATAGERVRVNVPLSLAEKILPAIDSGDLHNGRVRICKADLDNVDIRAILDAVRTSPDNEFVTVEEHDQHVRVAKSGGNLVVHVIDKDRHPETVDVTIPMTVVDALVATAKSDELDIAAAIRALSDAGASFLVTVHDAEQDVRIWVDGQSTAN